MKTKIIPFDLEMAEKIQAGEIAGAIKTRSGLSVKRLRTNMKAAQCVAAVVKLEHSEFLGSFYASGKFYWGSESSDFDLVLEIPDNELQFKPFDKVLVRELVDSRVNNSITFNWLPAFFQRMYIDTDLVESKQVMYVANNLKWRYCIPYEGNEHLVGTTDKPE